MKRYICLFFIAVFMIMASSVFAEETIELENGTITVENGVLTKFTSYICTASAKTSDMNTQVVIPEGITAIGESAFSECRYLDSVVIPEGVTTIGPKAFYRDSLLVTVFLPKSLTSISSEAFYSCGNLKNVNFSSSGLKTIGNTAFGSCRNLTSIVFPDSLKSIGDGAFRSCQELSEITFPEGLDTIGNYAFEWCYKLTEVIFPKTMTSIGYNAFSGCTSLETVIMPDSISEINVSIFKDCTSLKNVKLSPIAAPTSGSQPSGTAMFEGCTALTNIDLSPLGYIPSQMFANCTGLTNVTIPVGIVYIFDRAFSGCSNLTDIWIPRSAARIGTYNEPEDWVVIPSTTTIHTAPNSNAAKWGAEHGNKVVYDYDLPEPTKTPVKPANTPTKTQVPTKTPTPTKTPLPPTNTPTPTSTYTSTPTNTPVPPTATPLPGGQSVTAFSIWLVKGETYEDVTKKTVEIDLVSGEKLTLKALVPDNAYPEIAWKNSSAKAADISVSGDTAVVTGLKAGTTKITASYKDGKKTVKALVTVKFAAKVQPGSLVISGSDIVAEKKTVKLTVNFNQPVQPTNNKVTWVSENKKIASVSSAGVVKGLQQGDVRITACSKEQTNICDSVVIHVKPITKTVRIVDQDNGQLLIDLGTTGFSYEKTEYKLSAEAISSTGSKEELSQEFDWKSSNVSVATVENGIVKGIKSGKVTITAAAKDGSKKSAKVNIKVVSNLHGKLTVEFISEKQIRKGGAEYPQFTLEAVIDQTHQPDNNKVKWTAEDSTLLSINTKGIVTPKLTNRVANYRGYSSVKACLAAYPDVCDSFTFIFHDTDDGFYIDPYFGKDTSAESLLLQDAGGNYYFNSDETGDGLGTETSVDSGSETSVLTDNGLDENVNKPEISDTDGNENFVNEEPDPQFGENVDRQEDTVGTSPHFASNEIWMTAGESLILNVLDADEEAVIVGLDGDTDAVLWSEELRMLTAVGEAEVTAFLSTIDPVEIKDMMAIHIIGEIPEEEDISEETGEAEGAVIEENENVVIESAEPAEGENTSEVAESVEGGEIIETGEPAEGEGFADTENVTEDAADDETREVSENQKGENIEPEAEETPAAEPVEIRIRDLGEYDVLSGEENGVTVIDRERFELDDETLSGLVFEIENESVAKLTAQSVEELLKDGIEIQLLAEGETKLVIRQEGKADPLREIRLVVTAAPVVEEEPAEDEGTGSAVVSEPEEEQEDTESGEETFMNSSLPEPEIEAVEEEPTAGEPEPAEAAAE